MTKPVPNEVKALARHLPVLGAVMGVVMLSMASISVAERLMRDLLGTGGDLTALVSRQVEMSIAASVKVTVWGEQVLAFMGF